MLIVSDIEKNLEKTILSLKKRGVENPQKNLASILAINTQRKKVQGQLDEILHQINLLSKEIGMLFQQQKQDQAEIKKQETIKLKIDSQELSKVLTTLQNDLNELLTHLPNLLDESVPDGNKETDNIVLKDVSQKTKASSTPLKPHWDLINDFDIINFELGNKITGAGFPVYKGKGARMVRGLINYFLDKATKEGYLEVQPPLLVNADSGFGTGQLPDKEGQMYHVEASNVYLIPTAEVPLTNIYRDTIIDEEELPIRMVGYSPCFRREAGSWGSHVRGLNRLHQFDKVEIVQITSPEKSQQTLEEMTNYVESILSELELPYRILQLCAGDVGFSSSITLDFEVYSMAQKMWLEVSSVSNFKNFQSNRMKMRMKGHNGTKTFPHTLNGSALALPRIMAALLENNQEDSVVKMPKVLHNYLGFDTIP